MAEYAASDPATSFRWELSAVSRMSKIAVAASKQAIKDNEKNPQNQSNKTSFWAKGSFSSSRPIEGMQRIIKKKNLCGFKGLSLAN